jgi:hypothetical protein
LAGLGLVKPDSAMASIDANKKRKKKKKDVSRSVANMKLKKKKKKDKDSLIHQGEHKVNCAAWGCTCQVKPEKKKPPKKDIPQTAI